MSAGQVQGQQLFLQAAKAEPGMTWDALAVAAGIEPRALKNYRMPDGSQNHRGMPKLARRAIEQLLLMHKKTTTMVHVRVDEQIKAQATETLAAMGLSLSDAVRVFLMRVVADRKMPFALRAPNAETRAAMAEADEIARTHRARFGSAAELFEDLEKNTGQ